MSPKSLLIQTNQIHSIIIFSHLDHQLIHRHILHFVAFCHFTLTPLFSAQKKCAPCHISWTYADRLHTFSWQIFYFNKRKTSSMKLDLRSSATRSLSLYFLFSKKSNEIFFTIYILQCTSIYFILIDVINNRFTNFLLWLFKCNSQFHI